MKYLLIFFLYAFNELRAVECEKMPQIGEYQPKYANFFSYKKFEHFKIIKVDQDKFILADKKIDCMTDLFVVNKKVRRFVGTSTTYLPFLNLFGEEEVLIGFQGKRYIYNEKFDKKKIKEINFQLNPEELIALKPDLVMAYPANLKDKNHLVSLRNFGIPVVLNLDYKEDHPLARAEWIIFNSLFLGKEAAAFKYFLNIEDNYLKIKNKVNNNLSRPQILVGEIQNGQWVTCGGKSDLALMIKDAGGELVLDNDKKETQTYSLERLLNMKKKPDIWLTHNNWKNLESAKKDFRYKPFINLDVFNNNKLLNKNGFNDYWESGLARPDLLLADLNHIVTNISNKNNLNWYRELK